ncbi:hypothetical protein DL93DRAFT_942266 [Clavulina sp. PMI_390]|nr:hypothetical protein DL93DRAFT_942266 [Clavulina sp. PMI_390]
MPPPPKRKKLTEVERRVLEKNLTIGEASDEAMKHPAGQRAVALNGGATTYTPAQRDAITNFMESLPAYANPNTEKNLRYSRSQFVLFLSMMEVLPRNAPVTAAWDKAIVEKWTAPFMFWRICVGKRREKQNKEHSNTEAAVAGDDAASDDDGEPEDHYEDDQLEEDDSDEIEGVDEHELLNNILYPVSPAESAEQDELCESIFVKHGQEVTREERVLTTTVYGWLDAHMANVITLAHDSENPDDTTVGARLWARIRFAVRKRVHTLIRRFKLRKPCGVEARPRLDSLELDLLIFAALTKTRAFSRPHYAQIVTGILTSYFGAFRPSSLVGTHDEARKISEMMCWGDIDFLRDSHGLFSSRITIRGFKVNAAMLLSYCLFITVIQGHENEHAMEVSTTFEPVERAEDLLFDPTLWYICVGLSRGIFEKYTTIDELIADESCVKLKVKSSHLDKAVYVPINYVPSAFHLFLSTVI